MTIEFEVVSGKQRIKRFVMAKDIEDFNLHIRPLFTGVELNIIKIV